MNSIEHFGDGRQGLTLTGHNLPVHQDREFAPGSVNDLHFHARFALQGRRHTGGVLLDAASDRAAPDGDTFHRITSSWRKERLMVRAVLAVWLLKSVFAGPIIVAEPPLRILLLEGRPALGVGLRLGGVGSVRWACVRLVAGRYGTAVFFLVRHVYLPLAAAVWGWALGN